MLRSHHSVRPPKPKFRPTLLDSFKDSMQRSGIDWSGRDTLMRNPCIGIGPLEEFQGMRTHDIDENAPMIWRYRGTDYQMELLAGFVAGH
jgi:hypothetical protein